ncbi:MAG: heat-shock protein Hsp20 [Desulfobacterales bacterium]|nr:MAG: heat-shock protein Hsp20 [Desulfobacterales bacterium]
MIVRRMFNTPGWSRRSPFDDLDEMRRRMERLSSALGAGFADETAGAGVFPLVNISEDKDAYRVRAELPGVAASDLDLSITGGSLTISGKRLVEEEGENARYHRKERTSGSFSRVIELPDVVDGEKVGASFTNGVLLVTLPKSPAARPRQITVS